MSVKVIARRFDPHFAAEFVTLENSLGVQHELTVHVADHESCPSCGRLQNKTHGVADVEAEIRKAIQEFTTHEKKLQRHARMRKS